MTMHVTIPIGDAEFEQARQLASELGIPLERYLQSLVSKGLPRRTSAAPVGIEAIFDLVTDGEPTDIAREKDKLIGDAIWQHHLEETGQK